MWDFIAGIIIEVWFLVAIPCYFLWLYVTVKKLDYSKVQHLYVKFGKIAKLVFYFEVFYGPAILASAWPLQLTVTILDEFD